MKKETENDSYLANLAAVWFQQAEALDVYLKYEFTGVTASSGQEGVLEMVDTLVTRIIQLIGAVTEQEDRWLNLAVDRQPERLRLICASSGVCPVELAPLVELGATTDLHQYPDAYDVTVYWRPLEEPEESAGDAPC